LLDNYLHYKGGEGEKEERENNRERGGEEKVRKGEEKEQTFVITKVFLWCIKFVHINIPLQTQNTPRELAS
jgi:hypothetical protein